MTERTTTFHPSAGAVMEELKTRYPDTSFLALGQTALWDEPTKATVRRALDTLWPDARMIAAVHDTDYFAKLPGHPSSAEHAKYALVSHDDWKTRGLWSAAGEMSSLFGAETVPTQHALQSRAGVSLHKAISDTENPDTFLSELTEAWGWTGIIYTRWDRKIARDIPLADILPTLLEQIEGAARVSADFLANDRKQKSPSVVELLRDWVTNFARQHPEATLTDLYRDLFPRLYELLLRAAPLNLTASSTSHLLRFNTQTATLPRFAIVDIFLNPITRRAAIDAYNFGVTGSGIYTLEEGFGPGALPFDLVVPGKGRGTLCIPGDGTILVNTPNGVITLCDEGCDFANVVKLAELVERELGPEVVLVGKAVTLLPMLAAEYLFLFHEGASLYSERTRAMLGHLTRRGIKLPPLHPIVRVKYSTWDALSILPATGDDALLLDLPAHLEQGFRGRPVTSEKFSVCWRHAIAREENRLQELRALTSPRELLAYLARVEGDSWTAKIKEYQAANVALITLREQAQSIQGRVYTLYDQVRRAKTEADQLERAKGDDFRARVQPLRDRLASLSPGSPEASTLQAEIAGLQGERALIFDAEIASRRSQVRFALATVRDLRQKRMAVERGEAATEARATMRRLQVEAERAKARIARNALLTVDSLPHTDHRPSAWWFPLVDPSGAWFDQVAHTAEYYLEPLVTPEE